MLNFRVCANSIRIFPWLPLLLLLGLSGCSNIPLWNSGRSPAQVKQDSIARLSYSNASGKEEFGTGFFVQAPPGTCALLTVSHLVAASRSTQPVLTSNQHFNLVSNISLRIQIGHRTWKASNVQLLPELDLAIVAFDPGAETCPYKAVTFGNSQNVEATNKIYIVGYKAGTNQPESHIVSGSITSVLDVPLNQGYRFSHDAGLLWGMTGGPILNQGGEVIGINGLNETEISKLQNLSTQSISGKESTKVKDSTVQQETTQPLGSGSAIRWAIPSKEYQEHSPEISLTPAPPTAKEWASWGEVLLVSQNPSQALTAFEKVIELDPNNALAWRQKAMIYMQLEKKEEGLIAAKKAIELDPNDKQAYGVHALGLISLGQYKEAITSLKKAVKLDANYFFGWFWMGNTLIQIKQYKEAIKSLDHALILNGKDADTWRLKGSALIGLNKFNEALNALDQSIKIDPQSFKNLSLKGLGLSLLERWDECLSTVDKALTIDGSVSSTWSLKSYCLRGLGRYNEVIESANKAISLDANNQFAWVEKARGLGLTQHYGQALKAIEKALSINDNYADDWTLKGAILAELERHQEAIDALDRALKIDPKNKSAQKIKNILL